MKQSLLGSWVKTAPSLHVTSSLIGLFTSWYNYLCAHSNLQPWDVSIDFIRVMLCKMYLRNQTEIQMPEDPHDASQRIPDIFAQVKNTFPHLFSPHDMIRFDRPSIAYLLDAFQKYDIMHADADALTTAFPVLFGRSFRSEKGQFFTSSNVMEFCVKCMHPQPGEAILDPACGSGGFLTTILQTWDKSLRSLSSQKLYGIEKDRGLAQITKAYLSLLTNADVPIASSDSLLPSALSIIPPESIDVIFTNPPFGVNIAIETRETLSQYDLGHKWEYLDTGEWRMLSDIASKQLPHVLFIERCMQWLRPGGRMAIILPEGIFGNSTQQYIIAWLMRKARISAVISLSRDAFLPYTSTKTSLIFLEKMPKSTHNIFMAIADRTGRDRCGEIMYRKINGKIQMTNGSPIVDDDLPDIASRFLTQTSTPSSLGFLIPSSSVRHYILMPIYYNPAIALAIAKYKTDAYRLTTIGALIRDRLITVRRGHEIGSEEYGTGNVPFVRSSDINDWEISIDPLKCVREEIYQKYATQQDVHPNDILMISDGTFLIGKCAIVRKDQTKFLYQSHILRFRCPRSELFHPYLLLYLLNTEIAKIQIDSKTFVQTTIATIGDRYNEILLPIPTDPQAIAQILQDVSDVLNLKAQARKKMADILDKSRLC